MTDILNATNKIVAWSDDQRKHHPGNSGNSRIFPKTTTNVVHSTPNIL